MIRKSWRGLTELVTPSVMQNVVTPRPHTALRNAIMAAKSQAGWLDTLEWLYGGNGLD